MTKSVGILKWAGDQPRNLGSTLQEDLLQPNAAAQRPSPNTGVIEFPNVSGVTRHRSRIRQVTNKCCTLSIYPELRSTRLTLLGWPRRPGTPGGRGRGGRHAGNAGAGPAEVTAACVCVRGLVRLSGGHALQAEPRPHSSRSPAQPLPSLRQLL